MYVIVHGKITMANTIHHRYIPFSCKKTIHVKIVVINSIKHHNKSCEEKHLYNDESQMNFSHIILKVYVISHGICKLE